MQTMSAALGAVVVALLATLVGWYVLGIRPRGRLLGGFLVSYVFTVAGSRLVPSPSWDTFVAGFPLVPALGAVWLPWYWWGREGGVQVLVRLALEAGTRQIVARPREKVLLNVGRRMAWQVQEAQGGDVVAVEFRREDDTRPFEGEGARYARTGPGLIESPPALNVGNWKYTVTWQRGNAAFGPLDPEVCIQR